MRGARGFTLIEVLIATVLLAAGLTLAFATIGAATRTTQRGEGMASRSERMRAVEGFLRRRLEAARAVPFNVDAETGAPQRFIGGPDRMRFVADLPDYPVAAAPTCMISRSNKEAGRPARASRWRSRWCWRGRP